MRVTVDEAGQQSSAAHVDYGGIRTPPQRKFRSHGADTLTVHDHRRPEFRPRARAIDQPRVP
jgi:hypothetical protein